MTLTPTGPGGVPRAAFLPGAGWAASGLSRGAPVSLDTVESEGSLQYAECDVDARWTGRAGVVQAVLPADAQVGVQKVRVLATARQATSQAAAQVSGLLGCAKVRADAEVTVTPVPSAAVRDATGSVDVVHTVVDTGTSIDQWVVVAREGRGVSTLTVPVFGEQQVTVAGLRQARRRGPRPDGRGARLARRWRGAPGRRDTAERPGHQHLGPARPRRWRALAVCLVALFATLLDVSVTNVALPSIGAATGAGPSQAQWVVSGYVLAFGLVPVLAGRLGDDRGRRTMFLVGVAGFTATSLVVGLSRGATALIVARFVQGLFGGLINPQVSGLVQQPVPRPRARPGVRRDRVGRRAGHRRRTGARRCAHRPRRARARLAAGVLREHPGRPGRARARPPLAARSPPRGSTRHRLDLLGALLLGLATACVLVPAVEYDAVRDPRLFWLLLPVVPLGLAFWRRERRLTEGDLDPLVDLRLFRRPSYGVGVGLALLYFCGYTGLPLVLALYFQSGRGYTALESGLAVTAFAVGSAVGAPVAGRLVPRLGRPLVVGALVVFGLGALAIGLVVRSGPDDVALRLALPLLVLGLGSGAIITPNQALSLSAVDPRTGSVAGGVLQTAQRLGSAIGQAVLGATFFAAVGAGASASGAARVDAYSRAVSAAVLVTLAFTAAALVLGLLDLRQSRRARTADAAASGQAASAG
ncbi:hypothetical protein GCM10025868_34470 [Angustibacter aerolatus]|uniref:Major facilitator superfamily (MFS) profile domain-containing protein n=1 Tax=Angustibacter aerolatus TaxID=1162965 RepID=A0ABQ6JIW4_9ACTN|nr:hypothetical protein GCM10025868_34470 [Angustibacter aerolatus]